MKTLKLKHGIYRLGELVHEVEYDEEMIDGNLYNQASAQAFGARGLNSTVVMQEMDYLLHLYLGAAAIVAVDDAYTLIQVVNNLKGKDIVKVSNIGRGFFNESAESEQNSSEEPTGNTLPTSTQA